MELRLLLQKFPMEWRAVFDILHTADKPVLRAGHWLREQRSSKYGNNMSWIAFIDALKEEEPVSIGKQLLFLPRLFLFSKQLQHRLLALIYNNKTTVPRSVLKNFLDVVHPEAATALASSVPDYWFRTLWRSLKVYADRPSLASVPDRRSPEILTDHGKGVLNRLTAKYGMMESDHASQKAAEALSQRSLSQTSGLSQEISIHELSDSQLDASMDVEGAGMLSQGVDASTGLIDADTQACLTRLCEIWTGTGSGTDADVPRNELAIFVQCAPDQMELICQRLELASLSESGVALACQHVASLGQELSFSNCVCFVRHCLLPKLEGLSQNASRVLQSSCMSFAQQFPASMIQAVFEPLLVNQTFNACQVEIVCKIIKDSFNAEHRKETLSRVLSCDVQWNDPILQLVQLLVDAKSELDPAQNNTLLKHLESNGATHKKNMKFGKLILAVINKYGRQLPDEDRSRLAFVVDSHATFLKKSLLTALKKTS